MTREEALKEAQRRWGYEGYAWGHCCVGLEDGGAFETKGTGDSWEAAFADADRREKGNRP